MVVIHSAIHILLVVLRNSLPKVQYRSRVSGPTPAGDSQATRGKFGLARGTVYH